MTNPPNIDAIIAELSEATGPSRELDARVEVATAGFPEAAYQRKNAMRPRGSSPLDRMEWLIGWGVPQFTLSIDAAMTLAEGFGGQLTFYRDGGAKVFLWQPYPLAVEAKGATPAIALCIVSLRVRSALIGEVGRDG